MMRAPFFIALLVTTLTALAQPGAIKGKITDGAVAVGFANVGIQGTTLGATADSAGNFSLNNLAPQTYTLVITAVGYQKVLQKVVVKPQEVTRIKVVLEESLNNLNEVKVSTGINEVSKQNAPIAIEVYSPKFFRKNISSNLFESLGMINGVQPTLNCNVCNTGDIHINGMEGPYTLILIDGMPIVSSLSTVYGMMGIPNSMVERIEVTKGPASSMFGNEAMAGIVNVITKNAATAPKLTVEVFGTTYGELNADVSVKFKLKSVDALWSANYFSLAKTWDKNNDGFTDVTLQNRISLFNKYSFNRKSKREANLGIRLFYEDRWGGQMQYTPKYRGGDSVYAESIYTKRVEVIGNYVFPKINNLKLLYSYNWHNQNSYYGTTAFMANQQVAFLQLQHQAKLNARHNLLSGVTCRNTWYDDNTPATQTLDYKNAPSNQLLPGAFMQDEWAASSTQTFLLGMRYDYYKAHGNLFSPRLSYKFQPSKFHTLRLSFGNGFRVVNVFTEDHASLTGARKVEIASTLNPEISYNSNLNYTYFKTVKNGFINVDAGAFYTYFSNKIIADYATDANKIIFNNLNGYAVSRGVSLTTELTYKQHLKANVGMTAMQVFKAEENAAHVLTKSTQVHAPNFSATAQLSYTWLKRKLTFDYTSQLYSPMRLPILPNDFRPEYSPWFSIHNLQVTKKINNHWQVYMGFKNLFNFMPKNPIMRPFDPFDKRVAINNPNGYTFDPNYNYAPLVGFRVLFGFRLVL